VRFFCDAQRSPRDWLCKSLMSRVVSLLEYPKRTPAVNSCKLVRPKLCSSLHFLGFGSLADTAALIAKVCFVLFPDLRHRVIPQKRLAAALRYQEGLTKPFHRPKLHLESDRGRTSFACGSANALFSPREFQGSDDRSLRSFARAQNCSLRR
jgi:hypothetical protein